MSTWQQRLRLRKPGKLLKSPGESQQVTPLAKLSEGRLLGRFLPASRQRLREVTERLGLRRAVNLGLCLVT